MTSTRAFSSPISTGEQVTASAFNQLDDGQYYSVSRNGSVSLAASSTIDLGSGALDFTISGTGTGRLKLKATTTQFTGSGWPEVESRAVTGWVPPTSCDFLEADWVASASAYTQKLASKVIRFYLTLPIDGQLDAVRIGFQKAAAASGLPGVMPNISLDYLTLATGAYTNLGSVSDTAASEAAYEAYHIVSLTSLTHTVAVGRRYILTVTGDNNTTSSSDGLLVTSPYVDLTALKLRYP